LWIYSFAMQTNFLSNCCNHPILVLAISLWILYEGELVFLAIDGAKILLMILRGVYLSRSHIISYGLGQSRYPMRVAYLVKCSYRFATTDKNQIT
jgi:hypothetical protein